MPPLRIAFLWHFHQPFYKKDDEFLMPWVRMHGVKDYFDVPALLSDFPKIKQTFNVVPSLLMQLEEYVAQTAFDSIQRLTMIPANLLNETEKSEILRLFFLGNNGKLIEPYKRFNELHTQSKNPDAILSFSEQEWLDLQVWYNLTWIGQSFRKKAEIQQLFAKGRDFSEEDKHRVLQFHQEIMREIVPNLLRLHKQGQIELSVTPKYHPILPLLCDSEISRISIPDSPIPKHAFKHSEDADRQIKDAVTYFQNHFGSAPSGMWPSEGSVSNEVLSLMAKNGFLWTATDEQVLQATIGSNFTVIDKYFPHVVETSDGKISVLFRDHSLSDAIGFVYSNWKPEDAAGNFIERLKEIRNCIIAECGENALQSAVVPIILDGENCWEYYEQNGEPFLRALYTFLSDSQDFKTVTCSEAVNIYHQNGRSRLLDNIYPASWINANFQIWIGHREGNKAWDLLEKARKDIGNASTGMAKDAIEKAMEHIFIAEGSDWFWWYYDHHISESKCDFDELFRWHIAEAYRKCGLNVPHQVLEPIRENSRVAEQNGAIKPAITGKIATADEWKNAGFFDIVKPSGAMHQAEELMQRLWFGRAGQRVYFRCETKRPLFEDEWITLEFRSPKYLVLSQNFRKLTIESDGKLIIKNFDFVADEVLEMSFSSDLLLNLGESAVKFVVRVNSREGEFVFPASGELELHFL